MTSYSSQLSPFLFLSLSLSLSLTHTHTLKFSKGMMLKYSPKRVRKHLFVTQTHRHSYFQFVCLLSKCIKLKHNDEVQPARPSELSSQDLLNQCRYNLTLRVCTTNCQASFVGSFRLLQNETLFSNDCHLAHVFVAIKMA
jgi:hypothetical protein